MIEEAAGGVIGWLGTLDWGNVPSWFAAVGTVGALFLGLGILRQDRKKDRRASADGLVTWTELHYTHAVRDKANFTIIVHAYNAGDRPIPFAMIVPSPGRSLGFPGVVLSRDPIPPAGQVRQEIGIDGKVPPSDIPLWLTFRDALGKQWLRDLKTNQYVPNSRVRRLYRKFKNDPLKGIHILFPSKTYPKASLPLPSVVADSTPSPNAGKRRRWARR